MVDVLLSNESLSVFGGPASLDVNVDYGAPGIRGSLIFTGPGKPTDAAVSFSTAPRPQDLYINLLPPSALNSESNEYLFLYQFGSINGVLGWSKLFRLIPNTALANIPVVFIDGVARTVEPTTAGFIFLATLKAANPSVSDADLLESVVLGTIPASQISATAPTSPTTGMHWVDISPMLLPAPDTAPAVMKSYSGTAWVTAAATTGSANIWLNPLALPLPTLSRWNGSGWDILAVVETGLFFPVSDFFSAEEIAVGATAGFNIQYVILNESPISSGLSKGELTPKNGKEVLPISITAAETTAFSPGSSITWQKINGVRILSFVLVASIETLDLFDTSGVS
jgi:hypothetical protein